MAKVSVIIPCYNVQSYINHCIDSLLSQTMTDIEIICVDDGSTDETPDILKRYAEADNRVRVIEQKNLFAGAARNNGLSVATGEYVIFLDSDDFFARDMLEKASVLADEKNADAVVFGFRRFDDKKQQFFPKEELPKNIPGIADDVFSAQEAAESIFTFTSPAPWTKLFRRSFIESTGLQFQPLPNSNDFFFILSALSMAKRIALIKEDLVFYRVNMEGSLQGSKHKNPLCFLQAIEALYNKLIENGTYSLFEKSFVAIAVSTSHYNLRTASTDKARNTILEQLSKESSVINGLIGHDEDFYTVSPSYKNATIIKNAVFQYNAMKSVKQKADTTVVVPYRGEGEIVVSVVIPVYNTGDFLRQTVRSICEQSFEKIEIICVDDGSSDNSLDILCLLAEEDKRISVWTHENAGVSCTRNSGIKIARGKYIYFMDSDDILDKKALDVLVKKAEEKALDVVYFDADIFSDDNDMAGEAQRFNYKRSGNYSDVYTGQELFKIMYESKEYFQSPCLQMCRRAFIKEKEITFHPGVIHEDNAFSFSIILNAQRASHVNLPLFHRRLRKDSIMTSVVTFKNVYGYYVSYLDMMRIYMSAEGELTEENKAAALSRVAQNLINAQNNYADMDESSIGYSYGIGGEKRSFDRLVVRPGEAYRQCRQLKEKDMQSQQDKKDLIAKNKKLNKNIKSLKLKNKKLNKKNKELKGRDKKKKPSRLRLFLSVCRKKGLAYAIKLSFKSVSGK